MKLAGNYNQTLENLETHQQSGGKLGYRNSAALSVFLAFLFFIFVYFGCYKSSKRPAAICKVAILPHVDQNTGATTGIILQPFVVSPYEEMYAGTHEPHSYPATHGYQRGRSRLPPLMPLPRQMCPSSERDPELRNETNEKGMEGEAQQQELKHPDSPPPSYASLDLTKNTQ